MVAMMYYTLPVSALNLVDSLKGSWLFDGYFSSRGELICSGESLWYLGTSNTSFI